MIKYHETFITLVTPLPCYLYYSSTNHLQPSHHHRCVIFVIAPPPTSFNHITTAVFLLLLHQPTSTIPPSLYYSCYYATTVEPPMPSRHFANQVKLCPLFACALDLVNCPGSQVVFDSSLLRRLVAQLGHNTCQGITC